MANTEKREWPATWRESTHTQIWNVLEAIGQLPNKGMHTPQDDASLGVWLVHAPWMHPAWCWHYVGLVHLRDIPGQSRPPHLAFPGATHEFMVYRGTLLIHAGKSRSWLGGSTDEDLLKEFGREIEFGAVVARANLVACLHIDRIQSGEYYRDYPWLKTHAHTNGTWCWVLDQVERMPRPIPWKGAQGLWELPADAMGAAAA